MRPRGVLALNVRVEGTTYVDMFDREVWCLFGRNWLEGAFSGWAILLKRFDDFRAPRATVKSFVTKVARKGKGVIDLPSGARDGYDNDGARQGAGLGPGATSIAHWE